LAWSKSCNQSSKVSCGASPSADGFQTAGSPEPLDAIPGSDSGFHAGEYSMISPSFTINATSICSKPRRCKVI
jgi:hypothetical protein